MLPLPDVEPADRPPPLGGRQARGRVRIAIERSWLIGSSSVMMTVPRRSADEQCVELPCLHLGELAEHVRRARERLIALPAVEPATFEDDEHGAERDRALTQTARFDRAVATWRIGWPGSGGLEGTRS